MKIGFIGLGNVGGKLAGSLVRSGFELIVSDLEPSQMSPLLTQGARAGESGKSIAENTDVVFTCIPSPVVSVKVMEEKNGVLEGLSPGKIWNRP
jgi:3-hydroxyisobutyrate dehydrogenase